MFRRSLSVLLALLLSLVLANLARAQALAERIPADALVYVGWQGTEKLQPQYQQSHLKAILDASTIPAFFEKRLPALIDKIGANANAEEQAAIAEELLHAGNLMWKYPTALYVGPVQFGGMFSPRIALVCVAGTQAEALEKQLSNLIAQIPPMPVRFAVKRVDTTVMLLIGTLAPETQALLAGTGKDGALAAAKEFQAAMGQVAKDPALAVYINVPEIVKTADAGVAATVLPESPEAKTWPAIKEALNLKGLTQIVCVAGFDGKDWTTQAFVGLTGPRTGIPALFDVKPLTDEALKAVPQSASFAMAGRCDLARIFDEVSAAVAKIDANAKAEMDRGLAQMSQEIGLDLRKDILAPLGDQYTIYCAPQVGGNSWSGLTLVSPVKDAATLTKTIATLEAKAAELQARQAPPRPFEPSFVPRKTMIAGTEVHYVGLFIVTPAWAVKDGRLYASLMPQAIPSAVAQLEPGSKSLLDNPAYQAMRARLGVKDATGIQFTDLPKTAPDSYAMLSMVLGLVNMFAGEDASPALLPPLYKVLPELAPSGAAAWNDAAGWHCKSISPFPGSFALGGQQAGMTSGGVAVPAMMTAILLPSLGRARELANRSHEQANLAGIAKAAIVWSAEHQDQMPEHLAQLVASGMIAPKSLVSKRSSTPPLVLTPEQTEAAMKDWHKIAALVDEHCDFVYVGKGTRNTTDSSLILAYTNPAKVNARDGMNIVFGDAHAEWIRGPGILSVFKSNNEARKAAGLPEIAVPSLAPPVRRPRPVMTQPR